MAREGRSSRENELRRLESLLEQIPLDQEERADASFLLREGTVQQIREAAAAIEAAVDAVAGGTALQGQCDRASSSAGDREGRGSTIIELVDENLNNARIVVVGVGNGGGNAVSTMIRAELSGVDFISANTDSQAIGTSLAPVKVQLGCSLTKGLGAGANPEVGRKAALEQEDILREELGGADMVFVTAGMGGGTGTGAAPVIARICKDLGALTVGVVTKPFGFEGRRRLRQAEEGIRELRAACDTLIVIPNQRLIEIASRSTTAREAFKKADDVLLHTVRGISQIITEPGAINVDFADVRTIMSEMGMAMMGHGAGYGDSRAIDAATNAISSPLLEDISIHGARGVLVNITASEDFGIQELNEAVDLIQTQAHDDANIIVGLVHDTNLEDEVRITVVATGLASHVGRAALVGPLREGGAEVSTTAITAIRSDALHRRHRVHPGDVARVDSHTGGSRLELRLRAYDHRLPSRSEDRLSDDLWSGSFVLPDAADTAALLTALADRVLAPENRLLAAVLLDAVECYVRGRISKDPKSQQMAEEAEVWIESDDTQGVFSFATICNALELNPDYIRHWLRGSRPTPVAGGHRISESLEADIQGKGEQPTSSLSISEDTRRHVREMRRAASAR